MKLLITCVGILAAFAFFASCEASASQVSTTSDKESIDNKPIVKIVKTATPAVSAKE